MAKKPVKNKSEKKHLAAQKNAAIAENLSKKTQEILAHYITLYNQARQA